MQLLLLITVIVINIDLIINCYLNYELWIIMILLLLSLANLV